MDMKTESILRYKKYHNEALLGNRVANAMNDENEGHPSKREFMIKERCYYAWHLAHRNEFLY